MKSISIALLGLFASAAYAKILCKPSPSDCPSKIGTWNPSQCASEGFQPPDDYVCVKFGDDGLRAYGRYWRQSVQQQDCDGPQRLNNGCNGAGGPRNSNSHCCSGICYQGNCV